MHPMKKTFALAAIGALFLALPSCNLKNLLDNKVKQFNEDSNKLKAELDNADKDINNALSDMPGFGKAEDAREVFSDPLCGVLIDTSQLAQNIVIFNFDGTTPCFSPSVTRSGQIVVELVSGTAWANPGAVLKETFIDYKITRLSDNKSIKFNGIKHLTNVSGHNWWQFLLGQTQFNYRERAFDMLVTFDNNETATWNSARTITWSYHPAGTVTGIPYAHIGFEANGDTTYNGTPTTDSWGVNRYNQNFMTFYNTSIKSNTYCGLWRPTQGELVHEVDDDSYTLTLGVDQSGNLATGTCAYGFKVAWTVNNNSNSAIFSY